MDVNDTVISLDEIFVVGNPSPDDEDTEAGTEFEATVKPINDIGSDTS